MATSPAPFILHLPVLLCHHFHACTNNAPPQILGGDLGNYTAVAGEKVTLECKIRHIGRSKVAWLKLVKGRKHPLVVAVQDAASTQTFRSRHKTELAVDVEEDRYGAITKYMLSIEPVRDRDSGIYQCQINTQPATYRLAHLLVKVPARVNKKLAPKRVYAKEGENATITCFALGQPPPTIQWRRGDGTIIFSDYTRRDEINSATVVEGETLHLQNVQRQQMGDYKCTLSNGVQHDITWRVSLIVKFAPTIENVQIRAGQDVVELTCTASGSPTPTFIWTKNGAQLSFDSRCTKLATTNDATKNIYTFMSTLQIRPAKESDVGKYRCSVNNDMGVDHQEKYLALTDVKAAMFGRTATLDSTRSTRDHDAGGSTILNSKRKAKSKAKVSARLPKETIPSSLYDSPATQDIQQQGSTNSVQRLRSVLWLVGAALLAIRL